MPGPFDGMQPGEWRELAGTKLRSVLCTPTSPCLWDDNHGNPANFLGAWSGGYARGNIVGYHGGGGPDCSINAVAEIDFGANPVTMTCGAKSSPTMRPETGVTAGKYADGRPVSVHSYSGMTWVPGLSRMLRVGGAQWSSDTVTPYAWAYDPVTDTWESKPTIPSWVGVQPNGNIESSLHYDPVRQTCWFRTENLSWHEFNPAMNSWAVRGSGSSGAGRTTALIGRAIYLVGRGVSYLPHLDAAGLLVEQAVTTTGDVPPWLSGPWVYPGVAVDEAAGKLITWVNGPDVHVLDVASLVWTRYAAAVGAPAPPVTGVAPVLTKLQYLPALGVAVVAYHLDQNCWAWKPAYAPPPPPQPPTLDISFVSGPTVQITSTNATSASGTGVFAGVTTLNGQVALGLGSGSYTVTGALGSVTVTVTGPSIP